MSQTLTDLRASDIMTEDPICVVPSTSVRTLARIFDDHEISGAPVVDRAGRVVGVVSNTDLVRRWAAGLNDTVPSHHFEMLSPSEDRAEQSEGETGTESMICVEDFMTVQPIAAAPWTPLADIAKTMFEHRVHRIIVVDGDGFPIGIITSLDVLGAMTQGFAVRNQCCDR
jgi:CBS domain-containing protein